MGLRRLAPNTSVGAVCSQKHASVGVLGSLRGTVVFTAVIMKQGDE